FAEILLKSLEEFFVESNRELGTCRAAVRRAIAFSRARKEGELADEKDFALNILDGEIHDAGFIVEDAQSNDFAADPFDVVGCVGLFNGEKDEQTFLNSAFGCAGNCDFSL